MRQIKGRAASRAARPHGWLLDTRAKLTFVNSLSCPKLAERQTLPLTITIRQFSQPRRVVSRQCTRLEQSSVVPCFVRGCRVRNSRGAGPCGWARFQFLPIRTAHDYTCAPEGGSWSWRGSLASCKR